MALTLNLKTVQMIVRSQTNFRKHNPIEYYKGRGTLRAKIGETKFRQLEFGHLNFGNIAEFENLPRGNVRVKMRV